MRSTPAALAVAVLLCTAGPATGQAADTLRIVTFNLYHGGQWSGLRGDDTQLERRFEMTVEALQALRPDIVGLQEASEAWGRGNVAARLARRLGLHHVHVPATERVFGVRPLGWLITRLINFREGPAILSRFPIVRHQVHDLRRCRRVLDPRVLLRADVLMPDGELQVYSTHTSRDDCQLDHLASLVREGRNGWPAIVTGDLNSVETSPAIQALVNGGGFVDAFRRARPDEVGATVWQPLDAPFSTATRRVDYVFVLDGPDATARVRDSRVVLDQPQRFPDGRTLWPSDHYGVLADVVLSRR